MTPSTTASHAIPVRQASVLLGASFSPHLTVAALADKLTVSPCRACREFAPPSECALPGAICPSCSTRRLVETAAHMVDDVLPRVHKHRYCGVLAPNAKLRKAVVETAEPSGATLKLLTEARQKMEIDQADPPEDNPQGRMRQAAARCWAMLLARIYECLPLVCNKCGQPMKLIAFIMEPPVVEKMELLHNPAKAMTDTHRGAI